jgi:hypothetical protein
MRNNKDGAMANSQGPRAGLGVNSGALVTGIVLAGVGSLLGLAGLVVSGATLVAAVRRRVSRMDVPPNQLAKQHLARAKAAATAGATAWRNGTVGASRQA